MSVRTVNGDIDAQALGATNYHEHLFQRSPLLPGDELDDRNASTAEAIDLVDSGFSAMIDATPIGLGRRPEFVKSAATAAALHVVATTGAHRQAHYGDDHWLLQAHVHDLAAAFISDITDAIRSHDDQPVSDADRHRTGRAGILKAGIGYWSISAFEHRVLEAVAIAHEQTGASIMIHLEYGSAAMEVLDILQSHGVPAHRVVLAHIDRNPDPGLHIELAHRGAYLGYDGFARHRNYPDSVLLDCLLAVFTGGGAQRVLIGGDVARATRYISYGGMPGLGYLGRRVIPRLAQLHPEIAHTTTHLNPARLLDTF